MGPSLEFSIGRVKTVFAAAAIFWKVTAFIIRPESMNNPLVDFSFWAFWFKFWSNLTFFQKQSWDIAGFTLGHQKTTSSFWPIHWQREIIKISFDVLAILWIFCVFAFETIVDWPCNGSFFSAFTVVSFCRIRCHFPWFLCGAHGFRCLFRGIGCHFICLIWSRCWFWLIRWRLGSNAILGT